MIISDRIKQLRKEARMAQLTINYLLVGDASDSLNIINGLSLEQRSIVVNLINNFKENN